MDVDTAVKILKKFVNDFSYDDVYFIFKKDADEAKEAIKIIEERLFDDIWHKVDGMDAELDEQCICRDLLQAGSNRYCHDL